MDAPEGCRSLAVFVVIKCAEAVRQWVSYAAFAAQLRNSSRTAHPFFIGDNPVSMQNNTEGWGPLQGKIGLAVRGIEIYLPISSTQTLAFFCRSHEAMIRDGVERMRKTMVRDPGMTMGFGDLLDWRRAFRTGVALPSKPDNVLNHNSLQVSHAERYVFSSTPDFELVESMIRDNAEFKTGPRPQVN